VKIYQTPWLKQQQEIKAKKTELIKLAQEGGARFVETLDPESKDLLISGLKQQKDRGDILTQADPRDTIDSTPYWKDPTQLREVTGARAGILGQEDNTPYAQEQFRAGARSGFTFGYDKELQGLFGAPTQDPGNPTTTGESIIRGAGELAGNIANPITWGIFGGASKIATAALGDTLLGGIATDAIGGAAIAGLWNTGEDLFSQEDFKKRAEHLVVGGVGGAVLGGIIRGGMAGFSLAKGDTVRLTKETGVKLGSDTEVLGKNGELLKAGEQELQMVKFVPETNSYIIKPGPSNILSDGKDWYSEINAAEPNSGRIWSSDGFKKIEFQKMDDGSMNFTTTEWTTPEMVQKIRQATVAEVPNIIREIGEAPIAVEKSITPPETISVKAQTIPEFNGAVDGADRS